jgi:hypothetical protein
MFEFREALAKVAEIEKQSKARVDELEKRIDRMKREMLVWDEQRRAAREAARALRELLGEEKESEVPL